MYGINSPVFYRDRSGNYAISSQDVLDCIREFAQQLAVNPLLVAVIIAVLLLVAAVVYTVETIHNERAAPFDTAEQTATVSESKSISQEELDELDEKTEKQEKVSRVGKQKGKAPRDNQKQKKEFKKAIKEIEKTRPLTKDEIRRIHDDITKQGYDPREIIEAGKSLLQLK